MNTTHVIDRDGHVWFLLPEHGGTIATRTPTAGRSVMAGIDWLEREAGPLVPFDPDEYQQLRAGLIAYARAYRALQELVVALSPPQHARQWVAQELTDAAEQVRNEHGTASAAAKRIDARAAAVRCEGL